MREKRKISLLPGQDRLTEDDRDMLSVGYQDS